MMGRPLVIVHVITGLNDGGAEGALYRLCCNDRVNRHVVVSLIDRGKYGPLLEQAGVEVHGLDMPRGRLTIAGLRRLRRLLRNRRPDVVQTWMYHADLVGGVVARLSGVRVVCWGIRHGNLASGLSRASTIGVARLCALLSRVVPSYVATCSEKAIEVHRTLGYNARFEVIPNGYDLLRFNPDSAVRSRQRAAWGIDEVVPVIGMVARYDPLKDHRSLLAAVGALKRQGRRFRCILVGADVENGNRELMDLIDSEGITDEVRLLGPRTDIPAIMNGLDLHVLSSLGEGFPNVLAEAMACGTPCVTTDVGEAASIVGDTGWVVPPGQPAALAGAIASALDFRQDPEAWERRRRTARQRIVEQFGVERMVEGYRALWSKAADGKSPPFVGTLPED